MVLLIAATLLAAAIGSSARVAPLQAIAVESPGGLLLADPRIADGPTAGGAAARIDHLRFRIERTPAGLARAEAVLTIEPPEGRQRVSRAPLSGLRPGAEVRVPVGLTVARAMEGRFRASVAVTDAAGRRLFTGRYEFGYPRYQESRTLRRVSTSALIRDDFDAERLDEGLWRVWVSDPGRVRSEQRDGRYWLHVTGQAGYNGLVSKVDLGTRDVEAVCRSGIESAPEAKHASLVHLCGSGPLSPDHWLEVQLRDAGGRKASATVNVAVPPERRSGYRGGYELPHAAKEGYQIRIACDGATNICRGLAKVGPDWWQLGDGFEVPARRTRLELKTAGWAEPDGSSTLWFDDCRVYPAPGTHYVSVALQRADRRPPGARGSGGEAQVCFDAQNRRIDGCDLAVRLYAEDGLRLVDEAHAGVGFGYAMLKLDRSGWDVYPVPAVIRVFAADRQIGPDHVIRSGGVEGLYPDDVYTITLE